MDRQRRRNLRRRPRLRGEQLEHLNCARDVEGLNGAHGDSHDAAARRRKSQPELVGRDGRAGGTEEAAERMHEPHALAAGQSVLDGDVPDGVESAKDLVA